MRMCVRVCMRVCVHTSVRARTRGVAWLWFMCVLNHSHTRPGLEEYSMTSVAHLCVALSSVTFGFLGSLMCVALLARSVRTLPDFRGLGGNVQRNGHGGVTAGISSTNRCNARSSRPHQPFSAAATPLSRPVLWRLCIPILQPVQY